jgi:hypothetical protein
LLWRIFYDPLLVYLEKIKDETGYKIELNYLENISKKPIEKSLTYNCTSYMDDTTLIGRSKEKLTKMVDICHEFFKINDIKANIGKYELIKINDRKNDTLIINNIKVEKVNKTNGNRYLGFYFRHDNNRNIYVNKIKEIIDKTVKILRWKTLTEKQIITIWNMVIIPRIKYQLLGITLTKQECMKLMAPINKLVKHKGNFATSLPNYILYDKDFLGLKNLYDLQLEKISNEIIYYANNQSDLGDLFMIHLK